VHQAVLGPPVRPAGRHGTAQPKDLGPVPARPLPTVGLLPPPMVGSGRGPASPRGAPSPCNPNRNPHPHPPSPPPAIPFAAAATQRSPVGRRRVGLCLAASSFTAASPPRPPPSILLPHLVLARLLISVHRVVVILAAVLRRACLLPSLRRRAPALQASTSSSRPQPLSLTLAV